MFCFWVDDEDGFWKSIFLGLFVCIVVKPSFYQQYLKLFSF